MSTYLLAFVVGEYDYVEDTDSDGVKVRVYTPVGKSQQGQFALEVRHLIQIIVYTCGEITTRTICSGGKTFVTDHSLHLWGNHIKDNLLWR